ncbi:MAG: hypothetical protein II520_02475 [Bacilli bacterium]|nr:hypothetical protein [Bacilli bacterium]
MKKMFPLFFLLLLASCAKESPVSSSSMSIPNPEESVSPSSNQAEDKEKEVDVFVFMGQSNMAGRGDKEKATHCPKGHGYEFRAVSDPSKLYDLEEPFGVNENDSHINDGTKKTGSLVSSFCEAY